MRLIITKTDEDLFVQGEWQDNIGSHTRRLTEDMTSTILTAVNKVIDWANVQEKTTYAPMTEKDGELQRLDQEIARLKTRKSMLEKQ